jgi:signal peptidase II
MTLPVGAVALVAAIVLADQVTKALIVASLRLHQSATVIPGLVDLTHVRNTGAAFGLLNAVDFPYKGTVIAVVAAVALIGVGVYAAALPAHQRMARLGLTMVVGGAIGNLIDRIRQGYVVDFVDVYWRDHHFWAFNVADSAITIGVAVMILDLMGVGRRVSTTL